MTSLHILNQTHTVETRKPAFRWLGLRDEVENHHSRKPIPCDSNKRTFGTDITNFNLKRNKLGYALDLNKSPNALMEKHVKLEGCGTEVDGRGKLEGNQNSKSFKFGAFCPIEVRASKNGEAKRDHNRESLASTYHPRYQNEGMLYSNFSKNYLYRVK